MKRSSPERLAGSPAVVRSPLPERALWGSALGGPPAASPSRPRIATVPTHATSAQLAASITFLLSADGTNVNGAILASDGGWSALRGPDTRAEEGNASPV